MFRKQAFGGTPTYKIILGLGFCTLGGAMLYAYFKNRDDDDEAENNAAQKKQQKQKKEVCIKMEIANELIPLVSGRSGVNLSLIEEKTHAKIRFREKNDTHKLCMISGDPVAVKEARSLLIKEIERSPVVVEHISVPQSVCGRIMGRCGEAMQEICRISMAKVSVDAGDRSPGVDRRRITISGNRQQVNAAVKLIEEKIDEDEEMRRAVEEVEQKREPRRSPSNSLNSSMYSSQTSLNSHAMTPREKLIAAKADEKPLEVFVSAVASPSKFWVQIIGSQSKKLDELVDAMTNYYEVEENRNFHKIDEPYLGQIVAAILKVDGKWYRAEIVGIEPNKFVPEELVLDLFFLDYGDSEYVNPQEVFELRTDFLTLRFQAVECFLANIKSATRPDRWDPTAITKFEEITQVATWKKLIARVVSYRERPKSINGETCSTAAREGSPIPGIELFDVVEGTEVNIGESLISWGFALPADGAQQQRRTPDKSPNDQLPATRSVGAEDALVGESLDFLKKHKKLINGKEDAALKKTSPPKPFDPKEDWEAKWQTQLQQF